MQCVILAAGEGARMRPLTATRPKVMLPIAGKPLLEHLIWSVRDAGIHELLIVVGYQEDTIRDWFGNGDPFGVSIRYVVQRHQKGTADALLASEPFITGSFLMLNGDMILDPDDIRNIIVSPAPTMATFTTDHPENFGVVTVADTRITSLEEKSIHPKSNIINAGAYHFTPEIFSRIRQISLSERGEYELIDALADYICTNQLTAYPLSLGRRWLSMGHAYRKRNIPQKYLQCTGWHCRRKCPYYWLGLNWNRICHQSRNLYRRAVPDWRKYHRWAECVLTSRDNSWKQLPYRSCCGDQKLHHL